MLQIGAALFYYKLVKTVLQIGAAITNSGNRYYKIGQLLQIGAKCITNWGSYYKLWQLLQIGANYLSQKKTHALRDNNFQVFQSILLEIFQYCV